MQSQWTNPDNANYQVNTAGTFNLTTTLKANSFSSYGHYNKLPANATAAIPTIVDLAGNVIFVDEDLDDTYIGVEPRSGRSLVTQESTFINMGMLNDDLFDAGTSNKKNIDIQYYYPLVYTRRSSQWTQEQVDNVLNQYPVVDAEENTTKWILFGVFLALAIICLIIGTIYMCNYCSKKKELGVTTDTGDHRGSSINREQEHLDTGASINDNDNEPLMMHGQGKPIAATQE